MHKILAKATTAFILISSFNLFAMDRQLPVTKNQGDNFEDIPLPNASYLQKVNLLVKYSVL